MTSTSMAPSVHRQTRRRLLRGTARERRRPNRRRHLKRRSYSGSRMPTISKIISSNIVHDSARVAANTSPTIVWRTFTDGGLSGAGPGCARCYLVVRKQPAREEDVPKRGKGKLGGATRLRKRWRVAMAGRRRRLPGTRRRWPHRHWTCRPFPTVTKCGGEKINPVLIFPGDSIPFCSVAIANMPGIICGLLAAVSPAGKLAVTRKTDQSIPAHGRVLPSAFCPNHDTDFVAAGDRRHPGGRQVHRLDAPAVFPYRSGGEQVPGRPVQVPFGQHVVRGGPAL